MAKLLNRSPAPNGWQTITVLILIWQTIVIVRSEKAPYYKQFGQPDNDVNSRPKTLKDGYLRFASGSKSFKVALFADLHFGENAWSDWGPRNDLFSVAVMSAILDTEKPDFVVYLGDVMTANNFLVQNASLYWDQAISPTRDRKIPWATLFGNHDDAQFEWPKEWFSSSGIPQIRCPSENALGVDKCTFRGTTRLELMRNEIKRNPLSYTGFGPQNLWPSVSNYVLTVVSPKSDKKSPVMLMYFLDSGGGSYTGIISSVQTEWFRKKSQELNPSSSIPEIVFWHIPSQAYKEVAKAGRAQCVGSMFEETVAPQEDEMGMMNLLKGRPSVKAIFVGHNHGLDWCCPYEKMWLCYARHTGFGGYGTWPRGARILEITVEPFSLKSWIRMQDDSSHSEVVLAT